MVPIVADVYLPKYGNALIKTELVGTFPKALATQVSTAAGKKQRQITRDDIPPEMIRSMKEWYALSQATSMSDIRLKLDGQPESGISSLDINPDNLVWVTDPLQMKALHLLRPSFAAVEMGEPEKACYRAEGLPPHPRSAKGNHVRTEDEYIDMWVNFLREAI